MIVRKSQRTFIILTFFRYSNSKFSETATSISCFKVSNQSFFTLVNSSIKTFVIWSLKSETWQCEIAELLSILISLYIQNYFSITTGNIRLNKIKLGSLPTFEGFSLEKTIGTLSALESRRIHVSDATRFSKSFSFKENVSNFSSTSQPKVFYFYWNTQKNTIFFVYAVEPWKRRNGRRCCECWLALLFKLISSSPTYFIFPSKTQPIAFYLGCTIHFCKAKVLSCTSDMRAWLTKISGECCLYWEIWILQLFFLWN